MVSRIAQQQGLYLALYCDLYNDVAEKLRVPVKESQRDLLTLRRRVANEGLSFLTKALPQLGKALDKCLSKNEPLTIPSTFRCEKERTTPELFRYLFSMVITREGFVNPQLDTLVLAELRQLMFVFYKLEIPFTKEQEAKCLEDFVTVDAGLDRPESVDVEWLDETADLIRDIFASFDPLDIQPRHGPGAVATGERNHEKHVFKRLYTNVESMYPFTEYYEYSMSAVADNWRRYEDLQVIDTPTAKVVLVPKDSRGPRIISCEPLELQWIQQGLGRAIVAHLESNHITRGQVNFTDQRINRDLALRGSVDGSYVTLDMKEASDRVSLWLVEELFRHVPLLLRALKATRSTHTVLPSGRVVHMKKFAPMGSCLCFPVESVLFYALAVTKLMREYRISQPRMGWKARARKARSSVFVYGDDIIVRQKDFLPLLQSFPTIGLKFNDSKCCTAGLYRESCGCDAYKGVDVTPLRLKKVYDKHHSVSASTLAAYVAFSNAAYKRGYRELARHTASLVEKELGELPITNRQLGFVSLIRPLRAIQPGSQSRVRYNKDLMRFEIRAWTLRSADISVDCNDWSMILRRFTSPSDWSDPGTFVVPRHSRLQRGWSSLS
jgi:hypothetical protein